MRVPGVDIIVPVLGRPHRVEPLLASIREGTPSPFSVTFMVSPGDRVMRDKVKDVDAEFYVMSQDNAYGDYAMKVNDGIALTKVSYNHEWIFTAADDLFFHPGWFEEATKVATPEIGVVGTNDLGNERVMRGEHATHFLARRDYIEERGLIDGEPGKFMFEGYWHEYVDDEVVGTAKARGAWAFAFESHVEHLHPDYGKANGDRMYRMQGRRMMYGRRIYKRREPLWTASPS